MVMVVTEGAAKRTRQSPVASRQSKAAGRSKAAAKTTDE
jgi:hypothetical protein